MSEETKKRTRAPVQGYDNRYTELAEKLEDLDRAALDVLSVILDGTDTSEIHEYLKRKNKHHERSADEAVVWLIELLERAPTIAAHLRRLGELEATMEKVVEYASVSQREEFDTDDLLKALHKISLAVGLGGIHDYP